MNGGRGNIVQAGLDAANVRAPTLTTWRPPFSAPFPACCSGTWFCAAPGSPRGPARSPTCATAWSEWCVKPATAVLCRSTLCLFLCRPACVSRATRLALLRCRSALCRHPHGQGAHQPHRRPGGRRLGGGVDGAAGTRSREGQCSGAAGPPATTTRSPCTPCRCRPTHTTPAWATPGPSRPRSGAWRRCGRSVRAHSTWAALPTHARAAACCIALPASSCTGQQASKSPLPHPSRHLTRSGELGAGG